MRHLIKRVGKRTLSIVLTLMMVVSTMAVGIVSVNAANITSDKDIVLFIEMETSTDSSNWWNNSGCYHYAIVRGANGTSDASVHLYNKTSGTSASNQSDPIYYCTVPAGTYSRIDLYRGKTEDTLSLYYNAVENNSYLALNATKNKYGIVYNADFGTWQSWSEQKYVSDATLTGANSANVGDTVQFTTELTTNTDFNDIKSNSLSVTEGTSGTDYTIDNTNGTITFNNPGTYTVKNTVTYNAKGFTSITSTADTNTVTVTVNASEYTLKTPTIVGSGSVIFTNASDSSTITTPARLASGTSVKVTATPNAGYQLDSIKLNGITISNNSTFAMPSQDSTVEVTFSLITPTVTLDPASKTVNVGESVTLTPSVTHALTPSGTYTVTKDGNSVTASDYISGNTFTTPLSADSAGTYVVTYTATVTSGSDSKSASASSTITVEQSTEQQAYNSLVIWLADSSKNPNNISGKTTSTLNAYKTAYTAAQTAVDAGYPASGTANTTALSSLQSAYSALTDKTSLVKPELTALPQYIDLTSDSKTVTLSVSNASSYSGANVTYSFYQEGNDTALYSGTNSSYSVNVTTAGTYNYYVTINSYDTDNYTCADVTSESKSVIAVTPVTVSVTAGVNGSAYVSSYTAYDNQTISNTDTTVTSVKVYPDSSVTFIAVPDTGYAVGVWNDSESSGSKTYTVSNVTAETNVSVSFVEETDVYFYVAGDTDWGTSHPQVSIKGTSGNLDVIKTIISSATLYTSKDTSSKLDPAGKSDTFKVNMYKVPVGTTIVVGSTNGSVSVSGYQAEYTVESGACYYYGDESNNTGRYKGMIAPATLASVSAASETGYYLTGTPYTLSSEKNAYYDAVNSTANAATAGGDKLVDKFKVTDPDGNTTELTSSSWTPSKVGTYTISAYAVDATTGNIVTNTVTDTVTVVDTAPQVTVNFSSNDSTMGSVSTSVSGLTSGGQVDQGTSITFTATPSSTDYQFSSWTVSGIDTTGLDLTTSPLTLKATSNVTVTANFTENLGTVEDGVYFVYGTDQNPANWNKYLPVYKLTSGEHVVRFDISAMAANQNYYGALSSTQNCTGMYWTNKTQDDFDISCTDTSLATTDYNTYSNYKFVYFNLKTIELSSLTMRVGTQGPLYELIPVAETVPEGTAKVYAKDGTTIDGGTYQYGDTKVVTSDTIKLKSEHTAYNVYSAEKDSYLTIQTTMDSTYSGYGFYVYAFCINGESYPAVAKAGGVYETTYKVTGEEESSIVEITPVYYNTNVEDAGDYISVYVDASQLNGKWGNTISCYSYYYYSGKNAYKTTPYPGQPMLLGTNGLYYTRVPRYAYENGERKVDSEGNPYAVSGVTLNSFSESELHGTLYSYLNGKNYQTYDYDDFKYIADLGFDTVKFVIEYRDGTTNQKTLLNNGNTAPDKSGSTITPSVYEGQNGWDDFYDFDGNKTDILGNVLTAEQQTSSPIYVVSTGNQNTSMGEWSTVWYVYDSSGNYVTQGIPSDFIPRNTDGGSATNTDAYQAIVNAGLTGVPVQICYESEQNASTSTDSGNSGVRVDGRWYYTTSTQDTPVDVIVQYRDDTSQDVWTTDTTGVSGTATIDGVTEKIFTERNVTAQLNAVAKSGYVFVEWGTVDDNGENYTKLSNIKSASAEFMIDTSYHLVARFEKVEDGSLVISHEKYTGPDYVGGGGYYLVSAVVYNADGTVNSTYDLTEGSITIPELASLKDSNCTIEITMVTKMKGENTFIDWYMLTPEGDYDNITQDEAAWGATGEVSQTITVVVDDLYSGSELVVNTLQYYSDIARVTKDAVLNYKYYNRFGEERTYTVTVTLDDTYIEENGYSITDQLIYDNAPAIEDLYKDCIWTITDQSTTKNGTTATIWGTHNEVTYNVTLDDGINPTVAATVKYSKYLTNPDTDAFYTAPAENEGVSFAYWLVKENGKEVARCYANEFNLKILGNYTITAVYANEKDSSLSIVGPTYTREQFTDDAGNVKSDYLYVDFIVAYMNSYGILLNGDLAKDMDYHTGLIIEFDRNIKVTDEDAENATLSKPLTDYAYDDYSGIEDIAKNSDKTSGSLTVDGDRALYKFEIDNAGYNNKNRLDYYVKFNNTKSFRHYVMKAYYYVYYTNDQGEIVYQQTEPVYFCLFEIGNSTADLS